MEQLTREQAIQFYDAKAYEGMSHRELAVFQINQEKLCMPFDIFHEAVEKTIGRPVFTHEFGLHHAKIAAEINGECEAPTLEEIIGLIPEEKRLIIAV